MKSIEIQALEVGILQANCHIISTDGEAVIVDPGGDAGVIAEALNGKAPKMILLTHCHYDHIAATDELVEMFPDIVVAAHKDCADGVIDPALNLSLPVSGMALKVSRPNRILEDGEAFSVAGIDFRCKHLPGHSNGSMVFVIEDDAAAITGDTIFAQGIGRSDFPGGDGKLLVEGILALLHGLKPETVLYPGHGSATTVKSELEDNPFL